MTSFDLNPARYTALAVGVITALVAALSILEAGGSTLGAIIAGLGSLGASLGGGEIIRANVEPVKLAQERRDLVERGVDVGVRPAGDL